jgi:hypothetical protein
MARGVLRVRRMDWAFPNDHLELFRAEDGSYAEIGELRSLAAPEALGMPATSHVVLLPILDTDRWEPYQERH